MGSSGILDVEKKDVFDILREWIKLQKDMPYGSIEPIITIENHIPIKVEIKERSKRVVLTANTVFH